MNSSKKIRIVSLFSGIGGFEEGIKKTGTPYEIVFASEIDKYAEFRTLLILIIKICMVI